jgi:hypothetical protein
MKFEIITPFDISPKEFWAISQSKELSLLLDEAAEVSRVVEEEHLTGNGKYRKYRVTQTKDLPLAAQKMLRTKRITYTQIQTYNNDTLRIDWEVVPDTLAGMVKIAGYLQVREAGTGCERVVNGEINVAVALIGRKIEKHVVESLKRSYVRAAEVTDKWLLENR